MYWIVFFITACLLTFIFVPLKEWASLWPAGLITLFLLYAIDSVLISLNAFSYSFPSALLHGLPVFYWLSGFPGGVLLMRLYPSKKLNKLLHLLLSAALFLLLELISLKSGNFEHHHWNLINSYFLNVFGFTNLIWLFNWLKERKA